MNFRVTPTTEQFTLPDFGKNFLPAPQQPVTPQLERLGGRVAVVKTVSRWAVSIVVANLTASTQHFHQQTFPLATEFPLILAELGPPDLGCSPLAGLLCQGLGQSLRVVCPVRGTGQAILTILQIADLPIHFDLQGD